MSFVGIYKLGRQHRSPLVRSGRRWFAVDSLKQDKAASTRTTQTKCEPSLTCRLCGPLGPPHTASFVQMLLPRAGHVISSSRFPQAGVRSCSFDSSSSCVARDARLFHSFNNGVAGVSGWPSAYSGNWTLRHPEFPARHICLPSPPGQHVVCSSHSLDKYRKGSSEEK